MDQVLETAAMLLFVVDLRGIVSFLEARQPMVGIDPSSSVGKSVSECFQQAPEIVEKLRSAMAGERELIFKHILTRDVAYETLPRRERPAAHIRVGEWIEGAFGERRGEVAELLAHHFDLAGDRPRALRYALEAGRRDLARLALDQARVFATRRPPMPSP